MSAPDSSSPKRQDAAPPEWAANWIAALGRLETRLASISPVLWYEVVSVSRRARWIWVRGAYGAALLLALLATYRAFGFLPGAAPISEIANLSMRYFGLFAILQLALAIFAAPGVVAGALAQERERRTIEYLFTCPLSTWEIVLGKLAARLALMSLLLASGYPVLMLALPMGGVEPRALWLTFLTTTSALVAATGVSIFISATSARAREALVRSYLALGVWLAAFPLARWIAILLLGDPPKAAWGRAMMKALDWPVERHPFVALGRIMSGDAAGAPSVAHVIRWQALVGVIGMFLAGLLVRRIHLGEWGRQTDKAPERRLKRLEQHFAKRPVAWKEMFIEQTPLLGRRISMGLAIAVGLIALVVFGLGVRIFFWPRSATTENLVMSYVILTVFSGLACGYYGIVTVLVRAATSIPREKERHCWDTLLSTTLTAKQIVVGKFWGALYAARFPAVAAAYFLTAPAAVSLLFLFFSWAYLVTFFVAVACLAGAAGIYFSLYFKSLWQANAASGVLAGIIFIVCLFLWAPIDLLSSGRNAYQAIFPGPCSSMAVIAVISGIAGAAFSASVRSFDRAVERRPRKVVS